MSSCLSEATTPGPSSVHYIWPSPIAGFVGPMDDASSIASICQEGPHREVEVEVGATSSYVANLGQNARGVDWSYDRVGIAQINNYTV